MSSIELVIPLELTTRRSSAPVRRLSAKARRSNWRSNCTTSSAKCERTSGPRCRSARASWMTSPSWTSTSGARGPSTLLISDDRAAFVLADLVDAVRRTALGVLAVRERGRL